VNGHQRLALEQHCRLAAECANPQFAYVGPGYSTVLTVNSGYE
jgi:hypothetical protein